MASGAAWLNETYAILSVNPTTGMMFGYRYRSEPNPEFAAANSTFAANQVKRLIGVAETARAVGPGARVLVLRFTESDDTSYTEAHVFPDPEGEPGDLLMLVNRLEGLEVRDKAGKVVDNQVVKVFKARKTAESVRDAIAELRPLLPVTVPIQP
ncbi:hypothetical protein COHA_007764 [Chlorella ohadii]|uniref:Uncharacterized protein n=1 Tax=Chlorella ohadii TaxID=2649997 RepID=A0AAD5H2B7_9CHLO|nr:hypothetical protein COHA_007764 [Chlorella ohadii]